MTSGKEIDDKQIEITQVDKEKVRFARREIKGNIPYVVSPNALRKAFDGIIKSERPDKFNQNYMETILKMSGGATRDVPPFLKKIQFVGADGAPSTLYSKFKTDSGRSQAAYDGLKTAFSEIFKRNEYAHRADEATIKDVIVEITGLKKTDNIVRIMYGTFDALRSFIKTEPLQEVAVGEQASINENFVGVAEGLSHPKLGLSYQINIVLPETENITVFDAIFKSLRENLLR